MGRTRTRFKNQQHAPPKTSTTQSSSASSLTTPGIPALITKTQSIIEQCDYDLANQFIQRILQTSPNNVEAREMLGIVQLETGLVREARKVSSTLFRLFTPLSSYVWRYLDVRISRPTAPGCPIHPDIRPIPAPGPIKRRRSASCAPALPIRTGHPDRSKQGKGAGDGVGL